MSSKTSMRPGAASPQRLSRRNNILTPMIIDLQAAARSLGATLRARAAVWGARIYKTSCISLFRGWVSVFNSPPMEGGPH
jgi:hypothetical protein